MSQTDEARSCIICTMNHFRQILDNQIRNLEFDAFLREHLHEYIEF